MSTAQNRVDTIVKHVDPSKATALASITSKTNGVAVITLNNPPVNSFSPAVGSALTACLDDIEKDSSIKAVVLTGQGKCFVAGADIPHLWRLINGGSQADITSFIESAHAIVDRMEAFPKPIVAAINGDALGGGLELAMACHARVASAKAKLGLPELKLGVIPGMGGTQRLPRLVGVQQATEMILSSKPLPAPKAFKAGLVNGVVKDPKTVVMEAGKAALALAAAGKWTRSCDIKLKSGEEENKAIALGARVQTKKKLPLPHALAAIEAVEAGAVRGTTAGKRVEIEAFVQCMRGPIARALVHVFLASKAAGKTWPGVDKAAAATAMAATKPPRSVAIVGGGTMGAGIAVCFLVRGMPVIIKEISEDACRGAVERVLGFVEAIVKMRKLPSFAVEHMMRGLTLQQDYAGFDKVDMVIEAAVERVDLKQKIMKELSQQCNPKCILATNTSTIDIDVCGAHCDAAAQARLVGLHFFSPAPIMPLVEVIAGTHTSAQTLATCMHAGKAIGKTCVVVRSCVGFLANRIFVPYTMAANILVQAGACPYRVDRALERFGMPMGPLRMGDSVGLDISVHLQPIFEQGFPGRVYAPALARELIALGRVGQKTGKGFYKYPVPGTQKHVEDWEGIQPAVQKIREAAVRENLKFPDASRFSEEEIVLFCMLPVVNEAARVLQEGVVASEADIDVASIMGYGFPAWRGGVWSWGKLRRAGDKAIGVPSGDNTNAGAGAKGLALCVSELEKFSQAWGVGKSEVREFFRPSEALIQLAKAQK